MGRGEKLFFKRYNIRMKEGETRGGKEQNREQGELKWEGKGERLGQRKKQNKVGRKKLVGQSGTEKS